MNLSVEITIVIAVIFSLKTVFAQKINIMNLNCADRKEMSAGTLCAIRPSFLNPNTKDKGVAGFFGNSAGFGYHVVGIPKQYFGKVHLHLGGSLGRPYNPETKNYRTQTFLNEAMEKGYLVIQLAYDNQRMINGKRMCGIRSALSSIDNCAGLARESKWAGGSLLKNNFVARNDSIKKRFEDIRAYLLGLGVAADKDYAWENLGVSGHSQGAGMALFISYQKKLKTVCLLAGGYDSPDKVNVQEKIADWIIKGKSKVPREDIKGMLHRDDNHYKSLIKGYERIGLVPGKSLLIITKKGLTDYKGNKIRSGHSAVVHAVELKNERVLQCLSK